MRIRVVVNIFIGIFACSMVYAEMLTPKAVDPAQPQATVSPQYKVDVNDIIRVTVLQPDKLDTELTVSPDGTVTFPYIGSLLVKGLTLMEVQQKIQQGLSDYMKYPLVAVSLKESRSRSFFVYGEVNQSGSYPLERDTTVIQAITKAGGFTRVASMNNVRILRQNENGSGNTSLIVDVDAIMNGKEKNEVKVQPGDVITVSKRYF